MISRKKLTGGGGEGEDGRFQYVCRGEICKSIENSIDTIVRAELFLGLVSSPARYSNFVYDNSIREIIIFVTIVTKKKKKKNMARFFYCHIIGLSFANKNCLYNLGKYHLQKRRNQHISGKSSQSYRLVVFLSRLEH